MYENRTLVRGDNLEETATIPRRLHRLNRHRPTFQLQAQLFRPLPRRNTDKNPTPS